MMTDIVRADSGIEQLIWIIVAIFWAIARVISRATKKNRSPLSPPALPERRGPVPEDLQELFETLRKAQAGLDTPASPSRPPAVARPMPPVPYQKPTPQIRIQKKSASGNRRPSTQPMQPVRKTAPTAVPTSAPIAPATPPAANPLAAIQAAHDVAYLHAQPTQSVRRSIKSSGGVAMFSKSFFRMKAIRLPSSVGGFSMHANEPHGNRARELVTGRKALKDAVISRIVLGPPKAL